MQQKPLIAGSKSNTYSALDSKVPAKPKTSNDDFKSQSSIFDDICILTKRDKHLNPGQYCINDCPFGLLRGILKFYAFHPNNNTPLRYFHRFVNFIFVTLGMYTLTQITSNTQYNTNYYGATVSLIYPILYAMLLYYFTNTTHFWNLCKINKDVSKTVINVLVLCGLSISILFAISQKTIWAIQQDNTNYNDAEISDLLLLIVFAATFIMRLNELFIICIIFWIISDFHSKQISEFKDKLKSYCTKGKESINGRNVSLTEVEILENIFNTHTAIYLDVAYSNSCIQSYLSPFLSMVAISFIIVILGLLFEFIDIWQFLNNVWELVIMFIISFIILFKSAYITWQFKGVKKIFIDLYNRGIVLKYEKVMRFVEYFETNKVGIKISGLLLDFSVIARYSIALISSVLAIGIRALQY